MSWKLKWRSCRGAVALRAYFEREDALGQKELGDKLGVSEKTVYAWKIGFRRPDRTVRPALERLTGIAADCWATAAERERERKLRAA